jgi:hypothetical protein
VERRPAVTAVTPATFTDGVAAMRVLDAIRESSSRGGETIPL